MLLDLLVFASIFGLLFLATFIIAGIRERDNTLTQDEIDKAEKL